MASTTIIFPLGLALVWLMQLVYILRKPIDWIPERRWTWPFPPTRTWAIRVYAFLVAFGLFWAAVGIALQA